MKRFPALIVLLTLTALSPLSGLDIYLNNILWHSYSAEALEALVTEIPSDSPPSLPFALLLPLMEEFSGMQLLFKGGDARLDCGPENRRDARLSWSEGAWELSWNGSRYRQPRRVDLYGRQSAIKEMTLWAEPGLAGFEEQIRIWSTLHKLEFRYREIANIGNELVSCRLTGEALPDYILCFLPPDSPFSEEKTVAYLLQSARMPGETFHRLVLPQGERFHSDLFLSLLMSQGPALSDPLHPRIPLDKDTLSRAQEVYFRLILTKKTTEPDGLSGAEGSRSLYFPARRFPEVPGSLVPLPDPEGGENLPPRVLPLQLQEGSGALPATALLDFLRLPGIQHSLLSAEQRQLPAETDLLLNSQLNPEEKALYREWQTGYVLSAENKTLTGSLERIFPDPYKSGRVLP